jgi:hypothetical protein
MYVLAIQNNRIEINARPITYLNSPVQQMFYPSIINEYIWDQECNSAKLLHKSNDNGLIQITTDMYGGFELFMQFDKSNNYDWTFAKTKLCVLLLADASYILNKVDGLLTPTVIRILRIAHWLSTTLPTNSAVDNISSATLRLRSMYGTLAAMDSVQTIEEAELYKQFPLKDAPYPVTDTEAQVALGYVFDSIMVIENQFNERIL